jgi:hypothetical protein
MLAAFLMGFALKLIMTISHVADNVNRGRKLKHVSVGTILGTATAFGLIFMAVLYLWRLL